MCPFCGAPLGPAQRAPKSVARTMVGVVRSDLSLPSAPRAPAAGAPGPDIRATIAGMPLPELTPGSAPLPPEAAPGALPLPPSSVNRTMLGMNMVPPGEAPGLPASPALHVPPHAPPHAAAQDPPRAKPAQHPAARSQSAIPLPVPANRTLLGVARPGIAPLTPGEPEAPEDDDNAATQLHNGSTRGSYAAMDELGATLGPLPGAVFPKIESRPLPRARDDLRRRRYVPAPQGLAKRRPLASKRALVLIIAGSLLAIVAVLFAILWPSPPPLTARARADAEGHDSIEIQCKGCPDGTKITAAGASATIAGGAALVRLTAGLSLGENRMKISIDRPGRGRDETVSVALNVAYRIRPDLNALQGDRPAIQVIAEAASGTRIVLDGKVMQSSGGRAVETVDVSAACEGLSGEPRSLSRQIPYTVTTESGPPEQGLINVAVGIVPLQLEAPGPHVIIDRPSFMLAGRTMKGAEILAAGRPIAVRPDGTFAQVMNVSSVGATQIEVRAKFPGLAPRFSRIKVQRVENLDVAAREFLAEAPITYGPLAQNIGGQLGKPVALTGEVLEARKQGYETVMLLDVSTTSGCPSAGACAVRLVQGADNPAKKGDTLRVFGHVSRAFSAPGRADIPEVEVDFTMKGAR